MKERSGWCLGYSKKDSEKKIEDGRKRSGVQRITARGWKGKKWKMKWK